MNLTIYQKLGQRIRDLRIIASLSLEELAFRAEINRNYLGDIERGTRNPTLMIINQIAKGLNVPIYTLFIE